MTFRNAEINPGRICNNRCLFCMSGEDREDHDPWVHWGAMRAEIVRHHNNGARSLGILGGEPSVYPHIVECISFAKELGFKRIALCSNGTRLADKRFLLKLMKAGLTRVTVSIHSHRAEVEDRLTGVPGNCKRKLRAIGHLVELKRLGRLKDNLSLNPVLCRPNLEDLEEYLLFFKKKGVDDIRFNFIWPQGRVEKDKSFVPSYREAVPRILSLVRSAEKMGGVRLSFGGVPYCVLPPAFQRRWPILEKYFYEEGNDLPTDVSFLRSEGAGESERFNWQERSRNEYRGRVEGCRSCPLATKCMGIFRSYMELYGDKEFGRHGGPAA